MINARTARFTSALKQSESIRLGQPIRIVSGIGPVPGSPNRHWLIRVNPRLSPFLSAKKIPYLNLPARSDKRGSRPDNKTTKADAPEGCLI
jgi:hypothetical protein